MFILAHLQNLTVQGTRNTINMLVSEDVVDYSLMADAVFLVKPYFNTTFFTEKCVRIIARLIWIRCITRLIWWLSFTYDYALDFPLNNYLIKSKNFIMRKWYSNIPKEVVCLLHKMVTTEPLLCSIQMCFVSSCSCLHPIHWSQSVKWSMKM